MERARPLRPGLLQPRLCPARGTPRSGTISDLEKNWALLEWLRWQVGQTERRIRELEIQEAQDRKRQERARAEMLWKIQPQRSSSTALLHRGGCATYPDQVGLISREDAMIALAEPDIEPCRGLPAGHRTAELSRRDQRSALTRYFLGQMTPIRTPRRI